ncbi:MAG: phosphatase PAP2 family protein [Candidatus Brennerbacteria bacterium]|nr:phosphatase PAP2 family protein [Candidatus Brennerbacteria bacterium]
MIFDTVIFNFLRSFVGKIQFFDWLIIFLADDLAYVLVFAALVYFVFIKNRILQWRLFLSALLAVILSRGIITELFHFFYNHPRPFFALSFEPLIQKLNSNSFPSGHAAFFFALSGILFFENKRLGIWFFIASILMGIARVAAGVHWPTDIIAGFLVGILSAVISRRIIGT